MVDTKQPQTRQTQIHQRLLQISRELVGAQDLEQLLQTMVDAALEIVPAADRCVIHLLDDDGKRLIPRVCAPWSPVTLSTRGFSCDVGVAGRTLRERRTICVNDTTHSPDYAPLRSRSDLRSLLVSPLYVGQASLGTLSISSANKYAFDDQDAEHIRTLAAQASVAIRQANLLHDAIAERQRSESIIESMADGLFILDAHGRVIRTNPALCELLDLDQQWQEARYAENALPRALAILLDPSGACIMGPYCAIVPLSNGRELAVEVRPTALADPRLAEVRVVHDITRERSDAEARAAFISQISHELRAPLQHILGFASIISDIADLAEEDLRRFFGHIRDEVDQLTRLVDDLVELSRIDTGHFRIHPEDVELGSLVREAIARLQPRATLKMLSLAYEGPSKPVWTHTDPGRLTQVIVNLTGNAIKFTPPQGHITVAVSVHGHQAQVDVRDSGPGISPEEVDRVFDRFYQGSINSRQRHAGMGLGLYISREIIRALGGRIWVTSQEGQGTTFSFQLPLAAEAIEGGAPV
ncbi:MAG: GAF domain-containing protein [Anaerolineae bacterium]|nr:GAF domain-containing protein [Anaerolineae bacterium]